MAQHDMNIANQGFPATRADINNALQALATNSSGTSAPSTTFANQWWYDTTNNKLYIRNEANNAWIEVAVLDQTANEWQITTGTIKAKDSDGLVFKTDDGTTRINISDAGNVGIGMTPSQLLDLEATSGLSARFYAGGSFKAGIQVATASGNMIATSVADDLAIRSQSDILFSSGGNTERARITDNGITFNGDTAAANALDDYEEGLHTVTISPETSGTLGLFSSSDTFSYTKIGRMVHVNGWVQIETNSSAVGTFVNLSLPFAAVNLQDVGGRVGGAQTYIDASASNAVSAIGAYLVEGSSNLQIFIDASTLAAGDDFIVDINYNA